MSVNPNRIPFQRVMKLKQTQAHIVTITPCWLSNKSNYYLPVINYINIFHISEAKSIRTTMTSGSGYFSFGICRVRQKNWRFSNYSTMKCTLFEFITKIICISKHFSYNIHILNIVSVRWRPLLSEHSRKRRTSDKSLTHSFDVFRSSKWRLSSWTFSFCGRRCFSAVSHPQQYSIATRDTVVPMNIEVPTKYLLSHNDRTVVLESRLHSESPMLYRPALLGNWNALSLARRALKDKFPTPTIPLIAVLPNRHKIKQNMAAVRNLI